MPRLPTSNAPANKEELAELLKNDTKIKVCGVDVDGVLRGKVVNKAKFLSAVKPGFGFCSVIFAWDILDTSYPKPLSVDGTSDILAHIDLSTFRRLPWEQNIPLFLCSFYLARGKAKEKKKENDAKAKEQKGKGVEADGASIGQEESGLGYRLQACPRGLLEVVVQKIEQHGQQAGWECVAGAEFEYFQFKETPTSLIEKKFIGLEALTPGMHGYSMLRPALNQEYFYELFDTAKEFGIEVEGHHTETGPGVFESALEYTEALRMADNAVLFKLLAKSVGMKYGIMPTFMAKPYGDLPGTSGHIHVSIRDKSGKNVFALSEDEIKDGGRKEAKSEDTRYISKVAEQFLAGIMAGLPDVMPMLCPNINSYKRLQGGAAFWAPDVCAYGFDSRAAAVRIIGPPDTGPKATRFEVRVPGADMHPMLAFAAIFGLGLRGMEQQLELLDAPLSSYSSKPDQVPRLPSSLEAATERFMAKESMARKVFGDEFVEHFGATRQNEVNLFRKAVTNWETERYFELA